MFYGLFELFILFCFTFRRIGEVMHIEIIGQPYQLFILPTGCKPSFYMFYSLFELLVLFCYKYRRIGEVIEIINLDRRLFCGVDCTREDNGQQ